MPGPQFLTPQPVFSSRPRRRFTLEQANRALPLVRRVVDDIVQTREEATQLQSRLESAGAKDQKRIQQDLDVAIDKLHADLCCNRVSDVIEATQKLIADDPTNQRVAELHAEAARIHGALA